MSNESDKQVADQLRKIFSDPKTSAKVADVLLNDRPVGWGRRSNAPYFKESYGLQMKETLDQMMKDHIDVWYPYKEYQEKYGIGRDTLYLRINQSLRYLFEKLDDTEHTYARFYEKLETSRERGLGVVIRFRPEFSDPEVANFQPRQVIPPEEIPEWKEKIDRFLESSETGRTLHIEKLALTVNQIAEIKVQLTGLTNIISNITAHSIKLIKINL